MPQAESRDDRRKAVVNLKRKTAAVVKLNSASLTLLGLQRDQFKSVVQEAITRNPDIVNAKLASFGMAIAACCRDGLIPDGYQAAMWANRSGAVTYLPMVGGLSLAASRALDADIRTGHAYTKDKFKYVERPGEKPLIELEPYLKDDNRGELMVSYAVVTIPGKPPFSRIFTKRQIEAAKAVSKKESAGPWQKFPERMAEKAVLKSLLHSLKYLWIGLGAKAEAFAESLDEDSDFKNEIDVTPDDNEGGSDVTDAQVEDVTDSQEAEADQAEEQDSEKVRKPEKRRPRRDVQSQADFDKELNAREPLAPPSTSDYDDYL